MSNPPSTIYPMSKITARSDDRCHNKMQSRWIITFGSLVFCIPIDERLDVDMKTYEPIKVHEDVSSSFAGVIRKRDTFQHGCKGLPCYLVYYGVDTSFIKHITSIAEKAGPLCISIFMYNTWGLCCTINHLTPASLLSDSRRPTLLSLQIIGHIAYNFPAQRTAEDESYTSGLVSNLAFGPHLLLRTYV